MIKQLLILCVVCASILLVACGTNTSSVEDADLQKISKDIRYFKKDGHCFAVIRTDPYGPSVSITWVPCAE
jgi:hypothetical protein